MDNSTKTPSTKEIGDYGEQIAVRYLKNHGFAILDTNYTKKCGELDIVAKNKGIIHFIEVKTLSYQTKSLLEKAVKNSSWRPEERVHRFKLHQIAKTLDIWLSEKNWTGEWQIDVIAVRLVVEDKYASVKYIDNVIEG